MRFWRCWLVCSVLCVLFVRTQAQEKFKFGGYTELWARYTDMNPGSLVGGKAVDHRNDYSIRRLRLRASYQPNARTLFFVQLGATNVSLQTNNNAKIKVMDAYAEYKFADYLYVGGGRSNWNGLSRFSSGPMQTLLNDMPSYALATSGLTNDVLRMYSIYAKGDIGRLNYRLVLAKPFQLSTDAPKIQQSTFNNLKPAKIFSTYLKWQLLDKESNASPLAAGTYSGEKNVFNIGLGMEYQRHATWSSNEQQDTSLHSVKNIAVDVFYDRAINKAKGTSIAVYAMAERMNYGPNYMRSAGINNPASGVDPNTATVNGAGNAFPLIGTGMTYYAQVGGTLPYFKGSKINLLPAVSMQYANFDHLADPVVALDASISVLLKGHASKFSIDAQRRPQFENMPHAAPGTQAQLTGHKMMYVLKYRIEF